MISRRHRPGGQPGRDLLHQRAQLRLDIRVLIQQIREPARPPLRLGLPDLLQLSTRRCGELFVGLRQPLLRDLGLPGITTAQQPGEPAPDRLPHIRDRRPRHRLASELRQRHQDITRHTATPSIMPANSPIAQHPALSG